MSVATFRVTTFLLVVTILAQRFGSLQATLSRLDTLSGLAAFLVFWMTTYAASRRSARQVAALTAAGDASVETFIETRIVAGGWNGLFIYIALTVLLVVIRVSQDGFRAWLFALVAVASIALGGVVAFTVGGIVGVAYGIVELVAERLASALVRWSVSDAAK